MNHEWHNSGHLAGGPDDYGNDKDYISWKCTRCGSIAFSRTADGHPPPDEALRTNGIERDCNDMIVANIMNC